MVVAQGLLKGDDGNPLDLAMGLESKPIFVCDERPNPQQPPQAIQRDSSTTLQEQINGLPAGVAPIGDAVLSTCSLV